MVQKISLKVVISRARSSGLAFFQTQHDDIRESSPYDHRGLSKRSEVKPLIGAMDEARRFSRASRMKDAYDVAEGCDALSGDRVEQFRRLTSTDQVPVEKTVFIDLRNV